MKQSLSLNLSQQITLTPQLQQAIRLLQLSTIELEQEVQQVLESNLMLERKEAASNDEVTTVEPVEFLNQWNDLPNTKIKKSTNFDDPDSFENNLTEAATLAAHLKWQISLSKLSQRDQLIADAILDSIDESGFLRSELDELHSGLIKYLPELEIEEIEAILHLIQHLDPPGVGARSVQECLRLQLEQLPETTFARNIAIKIVKKYFDFLGNRNYRELKKRTPFQEDDLKAALDLIQSLNPRPGNSISSEHAAYVTPDVIVKKINGAWVVELNGTTLPQVGINQHYARLIKQSLNKADNNMLKEQLQEARWFLKSLESRHETLLKVANYIVQFQKEFFEHGEVAMKPLVLHDVAAAIGMHESTISRVTTQKYMYSPRGVLELKYFFSSHVDTSAGGECSATAIRALIKKLVKAENPHKPLSDNKIAQLLIEQGIQVARRTIAKYRESLAIPPSNERKIL